MEAPIIDRSVYDYQTILLVEDNEDDVFLMRNVFRKASVPNPLQVAMDGEQAIGYLSGEGSYSDRVKFPLPVIILMDLNMPKKNGLEVLQWIREHPSLKTLTVHMLTTSTRPSDVELAASLGANAYLVKPGKIEELQEIVKAWTTVNSFAAYPALRS
jgi:CheY-like chemotaxis protein